MRRRWVVASAALLVLGGCAQVLGIEAGTDSPWFCNAHVAAPSGKTSYDFHLVNRQLQPSSPQSVSLCAMSDAMCATPTSLPVTNGTLQFTLDAANDGYLYIPASFNNVLTLVELGPAGNVVPTERTFPLFNGADVLAIEASLGITPNDANGALIVAAYDCNEMPAADVSIAVTAEGRPIKSSPFYLGADYQTLVSGASTSSSGIGLVPNITPSDAVTVTLSRASDQVVVAKALVHIRAKGITELYLGPTKTE